MEVQLRTFLEDSKVAKGEPFTHTAKSTGALAGGWPSGSYYIETDYLDDFWTIYCNNIRKDVRPTITERPGPYGPLRVDFDFKSTLDDGLARQYSPDILKLIVGAYQAEIKLIIDEEEFDNKMLWCVVLEKPAPRVEEGKVKDGFHLHFPHFICEGWIQDNYLRDKVSIRMLEGKFWADGKFTTPIGEFIDKNIARKLWMLYGSMNYKGKYSTPYLYNRWEKVPESDRFGHAFNHKLQEMNMEDMFYDEMISRAKSVSYYMPRFMSVRGYVQATTLTEAILAKKSAMTKRKSRRRNVPKKRSTENVMTDLKLVKDGEIMGMISDDRSDNYDGWMYVGWSLFDIGQGCDDALEMWIDFSRRSGKYVDGECEDLWGRMENRDKTVGALLSMAKNDSPDEYNAWKNTNVRFCLWKSLSEQKPNEYDVSIVVCKMYEDRFVCADAKRDVWWEYREHRWRPMDDGITLKKLIVEDVVEKYCSLRKEIADEVNDIEYRMGIAEKDSVESRELAMKHKQKQDMRKRCSAIVTALKTVAFHKKLLEMCKLKMYNCDFLKKIDENRMLLGCENGVIDLEMGTFRDGLPDDYITFSTGLYYQEYNPDDEDVKDVDDYLLKVYPNKNRREYFKDFMASCMQGGNVNKRFLIATGPSDGAKSMTFAFLELVFGSGNDGYFGKFPRELIVQATGRSSSSGARPELSRVRGKRIMGCQEIAKNESINIGFVKEATGNDSFYSRGLYEKGTEIKPQFTLLMQCNEPPVVPGHDEATWSRIRVLDHESKFVKPQDLGKWPVPITLTEQLEMKRFYADPTFRKQLPNLAPVLLWKLFQRFKIYKKTGLREPKEVMIATDTYQASNDVYKQFIADRIERIEDETLAKAEGIKIADAFSEFKEWYSDNFPSYNKDKIGKNVMKNELSKRLGTIKDPKTDFYGFGKMSKWWGYKFIQEDETDDGFQSLLEQNN